MRLIEEIGDATLHLGDCREILPHVPYADAVITDPPYGVDFGGKVTKHSSNLGQETYPDSAAEWECNVLPGVVASLDRAARAAIFCGVRRLMDYPKPADIGGIICPNGGGRSPWGFGCFNPVLFYGASPYVAAGMGGRPTATVMYHPGMHVTGENDSGHPCPKPIAFMLWAMERASLPGQMVIDPFMGSGTTGVAAIRLGRRFVGIEIEPRYFDIACRRIEESTRQPDMLVRAEQLQMLRM